MSDATVSWLSGPVLRARTTGRFHVSDAILVGDQQLLGEVIRVDAEGIVAQVYEDTTGLRPGDRVTSSSEPLSIRLRPGLLGKIYDGLLRPLATMPGDTVQPGMREEAVAKLGYRPLAKQGDMLRAGQVIGEFGSEDIAEKHLVPPGIGGEVVSIADEGGAGHYWPIRRPRPAAKRLPPCEPLVTGQRIMDTLFPVARGGRAALPGGFGTGKTILQESLAKWCDADVIVYVGCGERGNEMAEVLNEFPTLEDPRSGKPLLDRTVIIANTSNMPVAAREASIYTGITVAGRFDDPLGGGAPRNIRAARRTSRRTGIPGLPELSPR
jgi:V/A-type H+-transporting ATPase subunit A